MNKPEYTVWGWARSKGCEGWEGPFKTREKAMAHGRRETAGDVPRELGFVAPGYYPDPVETVANVVDVAGILERMDDDAQENGFYAGDDNLFVFRRGLKPEAEEALEAALQKWARKYIKVDTFTVDLDKAEPVEPAA